MPTSGSRPGTRLFPARYISAMRTQTEYLEFAEQCDRLAKETKAERHRMALKEMAEAWRKLAEEADGAERC